MQKQEPGRFQKAVKYTECTHIIDNMFEHIYTKNQVVAGLSIDIEHTIMKEINVIQPQNGGDPTPLIDQGFVNFKCCEMVIRISPSQPERCVGVSAPGIQYLRPGRQVHLHDVRYDDWRDHREIGTGFIDFPELLDRLRASGFDGRLTLELEEADSLGALERSKAKLDALLGGGSGAA